MRSGRLALLFFLALAPACKETPRPPTLADPGKPPGYASSSTSMGDGGGEAGVGIFLADGFAAPRGIALLDQDVFFSTAGEAAGGDSGLAAPGIARVPRAGGAVTAFVTDLIAPGEILFTGGALVWIDLGRTAPAGAVFKLPSGSAMPVPLATSLQTPTSIVSDGNYVYIASNLGGGGVSIDRASLTGGAPLQVATVSGELTPGGLAVDNQNVYFVARGLAGGSVFRAPRLGGPPESLFTTNGGLFGDLLLAAGRVYFTLDSTAGGDASILSLATSGPSAPTSFVARQSHTLRLAADGQTLFWTTGPGGSVFSVPLAGGSPRSLGDGLDNPTRIAVGDAVYVTTARGVQKLQK